MKKSIFILVSCLFIMSVYAQKARVNIGSQIPLSYSLGIGYEFRNGLSINPSFGVLAWPYDNAILAILEAFGTEEVYIDMVENAFEFGLIGEFGMQYHLPNRLYFGLYGQYLHVTAADTPLELIESYYDVDISNYPILSRNSRNTPLNLQLNSNLFQAGVTIGKEIHLKNPRMKSSCEVKVSKNFSSQSSLSSDTRELSNLSKTIDSELKSIFKSYAYIPTINVYFTYYLSSK